MVVVTGASGLLGQALVRQLILEGQKVRLLLRDLDSPGFEGLAVERFHGNITEPDSLDAVLSGGVETVYHAAAMPSNVPGMYDQLYHVNVQGTRNIVQACRKHGVQNLVCIANYQALGRPQNDDGLLRESDGFAPERAITSYGQTMALACRVVAEAHSQTLHTCVILPSYQMGPFDYKLSLLGRFLWDFARGRVSILTQGGFELVDTRDVAAAAVQAVKRQSFGESFLVSGYYQNVGEFIHWLEAMSGRDAPRTVLPPWMLWPGALAMEIRYRLKGEHPVLNRATLSMLNNRLHTDCSKARSIIGFSPRPLEATFSDTWRWMAEHYHLVKVTKPSENGY